MKNYFLAISFVFSLCNHSIAQNDTTFKIWKGDTIDVIDQNGLKQGPWVEFHEEGQIKKRTFYVNDIPHGGESGFYKNGKPRYTIIWNQGEPHGFYQIYFNSGAIKQTGVWRNGKNVGDLVEYYETGTIKKRSTFNSNGELEGAILNYYSNEIIQSVELYEHGIQNGFTLKFDSLGTFLDFQKYQAGVAVEYTAQTDELRGIVDYVADQNKLIFIRDSLREEQANLKISKIESQTKIAQQKSDLEQEQLRGYFLYGGVALLLVFGVFMYNRFRVTQRQKSIIEEQKKEVDKQKELIEESHKEITDSIVYAKRIQSAILPPASAIKEHLKDAFILYMPKDVVAGDFYWLESITNDSDSKGQKNEVLFAAADCTGHGVPGAMVSVICNNALNRSVREFGLRDPGEILNNARKMVVQEFEKSEEDVKDGMDIAIVSLKLDNSAALGGQLEYAGANNPLWIIRNNEILETKADKQPIGKYVDPKPYTTHKVELMKGDVIYIFTDGYADQFGGERGKKFKSKAFKELLLEIHQLEMEEQKVSLEKAFINWRGKIEQIDDVCVIGVRV